MNHTPGPWSLPHFADDSTTCNCKYVLSEYYCGAICSIEIGNGLPVGQGGNDAPLLEEAKANARLIAVAPELLSALRFILAFYEPGQRHLDTEAWKVAEAAARAAIAKADGQP